MAFNFEQLLQNPMFQTGLATLGGAGNPGLLNAYNALQQRKKMELEQQQQEQQRELQKAQLEQYSIQNATAKRRQEMDEALDKSIQDAISRYRSNKQPSLSAPIPASPAQPMSQPAPLVSPPPASQFAQADSFVQSVEGGDFLDPIGGFTRQGVSQKANPDLNVRNSTPEILAQRRNQYWTDIAGDQIKDIWGPAAATVAYDAAILQGKGYAKKLVEQTGGDPALMIYQRRKDLEALGKSNPLYGQFAKGWNNRLDKLAEHIKQPAAPTVATLAPEPDDLAELNAQSQSHKRALVEAGLMKLAKRDLSGFKDLADAEKPDLEIQREMRARRNEARTEQRDARTEIRDEERLRIAREAAARDANKPPEGFIKSPEGKVTPKLTVEEGKATTYSVQMKDATATLAKLEKEGYDPTSKVTQAGTGLAGGVQTPFFGVRLPTNALATDVQQQAKQAQRQWAEAFLRFKTGAAAPTQEQIENALTFFPQFGDGKGVVEQKKRARAVIEKSVEVGATRGIDALPPDLRKMFDEVTANVGERTVVRTGKRKDGTRVIQYSDGSIENVK